MKLEKKTLKPKKAYKILTKEKIMSWAEFADRLGLPYSIVRKQYKDSLQVEVDVEQAGRLVPRINPNE